MRNGDHEDYLDVDLPTFGELEPGDLVTDSSVGIIEHPSYGGAKVQSGATFEFAGRVRISNQDAPRLGKFIKAFEPAVHKYFEAVMRGDDLPANGYLVKDSRYISKRQCAVALTAVAAVSASVVGIVAYNAGSKTGYSDAMQNASGATIITPEEQEAGITSRQTPSEPAAPLSPAPAQLAPTTPATPTPTLQTEAPKPVATRDTSIDIAAMNVMASFRSDRPQGEFYGQGYASGAERMTALTNKYIFGNDPANPLVDVAVFNDIRPDQKRAFEVINKANNNRYKLISYVGYKDTDNAVAIDLKDFTIEGIQEMYIKTVANADKPVPIVRLKTKGPERTQKELVVIGMDSPVTMKLNDNDWANEGVLREWNEKELFDWAVASQKAGTPVIIAGNFNAKQSAYDSMTKKGKMQSSFGDCRSGEACMTSNEWVFATSGIKFAIDSSKFLPGMRADGITNYAKNVLTQATVR